MTRNFVGQKFNAVNFARLSSHNFYTTRLSFVIFCHVSRLNIGNCPTIFCKSLQNAFLTSFCSFHYVWMSPNFPNLSLVQQKKKAFHLIHACAMAFNCVAFFVETIYGLCFTFPNISAMLKIKSILCLDQIHLMHNIYQDAGLARLMDRQLISLLS